MEPGRVTVRLCVARNAQVLEGGRLAAGRAVANGLDRLGRLSAAASRAAAAAVGGGCGGCVGGSGGSGVGCVDRSGEGWGEEQHGRCAEESEELEGVSVDVRTAEQR